MIGLNSKVSDQENSQQNEKIGSENQQNQYCSAYNENSYDYYAKKKSTGKNIEKSAIDLYSKYSHIQTKRN